MYLAPVQSSLSNDVDQQNCGMLLSVDFSSPSLAWHLPVSLEPSRLLHSEPLPHLSACAEQNLSIQGLCTIPAQSRCHLQTVQPPVLPPRHTGCASHVCCSQESALRTGQAVSERCDYKLMRSALCKQPQQKVCKPSQC